MTKAAAGRGTAAGERGWRIPAGLLALGLIPVSAGVFRLAQLATGAEIAPGEGFPAAPVVVHVVGVIGYAVLGAFQFAPRFRARRPGWHRLAGRLVVVCGLAGALSGLWLSFFHPRADDGGELLVVIRLVFGTAWALFLVLGVTAIRRRDVTRHRAWMIRAYAVGMGAGTQALIQLTWGLAVGPPDELTNALLLLAGWAVNLAMAEPIVRSTPRLRETR